jgi:hypothetical protein
MDGLRSYPENDSPLRLLQPRTARVHSTELGVGAVKQISGSEEPGTQPQKNERPVGVPAARGHGVMEVQTFGVPCGSSRTHCKFAVWECAGR